MMSSLRGHSSPWWQAGEGLWTEKLREQVVECALPVVHPWQGRVRGEGKVGEGRSGVI